MHKRSKRYKAIAELIDKTKLYPLAEAVSLAKKTGNTKFTGSLELHLKLGIDPKKAEQLVRGSVILPNGTGKSKKLVVFATGPAAEAAKKAGADRVGGEELVKEVKAKGGLDADVVIATPDMMKFLSTVAKILGPRGLMPNPKNETITTDVAKSVKELSGGKITFRNDESGNLHQAIGKMDFEEKALLENAEAYLDAIKRVKPATVKGTFIQSVTLSSSMGPGIKVQI
ncbi:50S ribosomal protein L1 [Candidatus Parcubacteria bacterium]|jgi:large subunit ribosomal protein L1|nr:MAG: 50S ribosomal protein L1 [Candidatus Parcubacteria bacterium]